MRHTSYAMAFFAWAYVTYLYDLTPVVDSILGLFEGDGGIITDLIMMADLSEVCNKYQLFSVVMRQLHAAIPTASHPALLVAAYKVLEHSRSLSVNADRLLYEFDAVDASWRFFFFWYGISFRASCGAR